MSSPMKGSHRKPLKKAQTWSPDSTREKVWRRRKEIYATRRAEGAHRLNGDDINELKGCIELGFGFDSDSPARYPELSRTLPALDFYCSVNKQYNNTSSRCSFGSSSNSDDGNESTMFSDESLYGFGYDTDAVKASLKHQIYYRKIDLLSVKAVSCSLFQFSGEPC